MKILYTLIFLSLISIAAQAQNFQLSFEDTTVINRVFYTDSVLDPQGIWQIGKPHKALLDSALTAPNTIITLTDSLLPPGSKGSFVITIPGVRDYDMRSFVVTFAHKFQFDSAKGGGYVEFSIDSGGHWHNISTDTINNYTCLFGGVHWIDNQEASLPVWWNGFPADTTWNGAHYFTGTDSVWMYDTILIPVDIVPVKTTQFTPYMFRFTAYTDSNSAPAAGWMIDNINLLRYGNYCPGGINEINSAHLKVYPDPATDAFQISMTDLHTSDYEVTICDLSGRVVMRQSFQGQELQMHRGETDAGSYLIQVRDLRTGDSFQKRIVFE